MSEELINIVQQLRIKYCRCNVVAHKITILNWSLPYLVEVTACTSLEPDEYRLYPELLARISVCPCETEI